MHSALSVRHGGHGVVGTSELLFESRIHDYAGLTAGWTWGFVRSYAEECRLDPLCFRILITGLWYDTVPSDSFGRSYVFLVILRLFGGMPL